MDSAIIVALITGGFTFAGVLISSFSGNKKLISDIKAEFYKSQAVTDTKIEELTYEVHKHNDFANRIPKLEEQIKSVNEKIVILHNQ